MYNSSRRSVRRALFQNTNKLSTPDHINLCWAWEQVTHDGTWYDRDNYQTWVDMAKIFNTTPKSDGCTYVDTMTPEELKPLWMTVEKEVNKYHCFYAERKAATGGMEDYHTLRSYANARYLESTGEEFKYAAHWIYLKHAP